MKKNISNLYSTAILFSFAGTPDKYPADVAIAWMSRMYGGIHYSFGMEEGLKQGKKVAAMVNQLKFKR